MRLIDWDGSAMKVAFAAFVVATVITSPAYSQESLFPYPPVALRLKHDGRVGYRVDIGRDGHATKCTVTVSSGYIDLDEGTCQFIIDHAHYKPGPAHTQDSWILWRLGAAHPGMSAHLSDTQRASPAYQSGRAEAAAALAAVKP